MPGDCFIQAARSLRRLSENAALRTDFVLFGVSIIPRYTRSLINVEFVNCATPQSKYLAKAQPLSEFQVIHLAVHDLANAEFPDRGALVLGSSAATGDDGLLQVREIPDLPLRAELVTLSACDTGAGKLLGQEGIASLDRAFLLAGAKSVIASLWPADDTFTIALMKRMYQHLADGRDKGAALRQAKLDLLNEFGDQALPVYWAGFTLAGDGSTPVSNKQPR